MMSRPPFGRIEPAAEIGLTRAKPSSKRSPISL
jgi:hypothetical protein